MAARILDRLPPDPRHQGAWPTSSGVTWGHVVRVNGPILSRGQVCREARGCFVPAVKADHYSLLVNHQKRPSYL